MTRLALLFLCAVAAMAQGALADDSTAVAALRAGCADDVQRLCSGVQPGGGRIVACLKAHKDALSDQCKQAAAQLSRSSGPAPESAGAAAGNPPANSTSTMANGTPPVADSNPVVTPAAHSTAHRSPSAGAPGSYLRMKKVQIIDHGTQVPSPAIDMLIPSDWNLQGSVTFGGGKGGCFSDLYAVSWEAKSADASIAFQGAPNYSWQYTNDPNEMRQLTDPNRRNLGAGGKPCPVAKPLSAEEYFRQNVASNLSSGTSVVSVEAFPELNQIARKQLGLAPGDGGGVRTEAIRARTTGQKAGKAVDAWIALAVVTRVYPVGRGTFYDCQVLDFVAFVAPKGKLEGNEKLFYVMVSSIQREPKWVAYTNGTIAKLYQAEAQKNAREDQILANFQNKVFQTINETTANAQRGANQSAFGADQNIRGVQTFRDPTTGNTFELSNQYDHAWLNGSNEYVMSDDANFNPNAALSGSWNQLQAVRPSP